MNVPFNNEIKIRPFFQVVLLGDWNVKEMKPKSFVRVRMNLKEMYRITDPINEDYQLIFAPHYMLRRIHALLNNNHIIAWIVRNGEPHSLHTEYNVFPAVDLSDHELKLILPEVTKEELTQLEQKYLWQIDFERGPLKLPYGALI